jgi:hypothetical protein
MDDSKQLDRPAAVSDYDTDFYAWALDQAARIRALAVPGLDTENVAEEIESLGRSEKRELRSRCTVLLMHLLKWKSQPDRRGESWLSMISEQRLGVEMVLEDNPSLRHTMARVIAESYRRAVEKATKETHLPVSIFPASCPWTPGQIFTADWLPD